MSNNDLYMRELRELVDTIKKEVGDELSTIDVMILRETYGLTESEKILTRNAVRFYKDSRLNELYPEEPKFGFELIEPTKVRMIAKNEAATIIVQMMNGQESQI